MDILDRLFEQRGREVGKATERGRSRTFAKFGTVLGILALLLLLLPGGEAQAATLVVTNLNASGPGSLAQAVIDAAPDDTITFSVSGTITIPGSGLYIPKNLTITGPGPNLLSITGGNINTAMTVPTGVTATVSGITFTGGYNVCGDGGAIHVSGGVLTLVNSIVTGNTACAGGGIGTVNGGSTTIINSTITGNNASIRGGGIVNRTGGTTNISGALITGNSTGGPGGAIQLDDGTLTISQSCIISNNGNPDVNRSSGTLTADNNWWGVATGPNTGGETTNVAVGSFLTSAPPCGAVFDLTPPVVNVSFPSPNGQNGWFVTSPVGIVTADDTTTGGSNITAISCTGATVGSITGLGTPNASAPLAVSAEGVTNVSCTATDGAGNSGAAAGSSNTATIQIDTTAPTVSCSVSPNSLWPPNHKLVPVTASVTVADSLSGSAGFTLVSVTSNEPDNGLGDGDKPNDIQEFDLNIPDTSGQLRAERSGPGSGRIYTLTYQGTDIAGNASTCDATVTVPHDQGH